MKKKSQAKRYAKALLGIVGFDKALGALEELNRVNDLMVNSKEFSGLLMNPQFPPDEREKVIRLIAKRMKLSGDIINYIMHLSQLGVIVFLPEIIKIATALYMEKQKKSKAVVMTPFEVSGADDARIKSSLNKLLERDVEIEYVMDPSLLGGILIKVGSTMYDTSIKGQLRLLKDELIKG